MRIFPLFIFFFFSVIITNAQIKAVTTNGDEVILNSDGTWRYVEEVTKIGKIIDTNKTVFLKNSDATFQVKSNKVENISIYINPKKWSFEKGKSSDAAEFEFTLKEKDAGGIFISERIDMPIENLKAVAFENAKSAAPDITIIKEEYRSVNEIKLFFMQMNGTVQGVKFTYLGYYFSGPKGTVQLLAYTSQNLLNEYQKEMEAFLNGMVVTQ